MTVAPWNRDASNAIDASQAGLEAAEARHRPASATRSVRAPWVFAADGARSTVRRLLGVEVEDFGVDERWLNFDTVVKRPLDKSFLRTALTMDPARPYMFMPIGTKRQRFEIRIAEHEREADVQRPEVAWNWLRDKQGLGPDDVEIIRQIVYPFETRVARQWRQGRVLIGGDAAHTMPPYAGEGACSAMRDARNAAWKLDLVLQGLADASILDSYEQERRAHYMPLLELSVMLCRMINMTDPAAAQQRNTAIRQNPPPAPPFPTLTSGVLRRDALGGPAPLAGQLAPNSRVRLGTAEGRLDQVVGSGFQLLCAAGADAQLRADQHAWLGAAGAAVAVVGDGPGQLDDLDGTLTSYLTQHRVAAVLARPDFVVYGTATSVTDVPPLVDELRKQLAGDLPLAQPVPAGEAAAH